MAAFLASLLLFGQLLLRETDEIVDANHISWLPSPKHFGDTIYCDYLISPVISTQDVNLD
jgi:hypothetical protein